MTPEQALDAMMDALKLVPAPAGIQQIIANARTTGGPTVDLYSGDLCAEGLPAEFSDTGEWVSCDAVNGGREYWEHQPELISVQFGLKTLLRDEVVAMVGEKYVAQLEADRAEELE